MLKDFDILRIFASFEGIEDQSTVVNGKRVENEFTIQTWRSITQRLLEKSSSREVEIEIPEDTNIVTGLVEKKDKIQETDFQDKVFAVVFSNFYPEITYEKIDKFKFNHTNYSEVWKRVYELYKELSPEHSSYNVIKRWINWSFGAVNNGTSGIQCSFDYQSVIKSRANSVLKEVQSMFEESVIYIDVDEIYFLDENREKILEYVGSLDMNYDTFDWKRFLFIDQKKFVAVDESGELEVRGFPKYKKLNTVYG